jgi:uridylate kinase
MNSNRIVISLGGSLVVPNGIDADFIRSFVALIKKEAEAGKEFAVVVGGGKVARDYRDALASIRSSTSDELDWQGIYATRLNAELVRLAFNDSAESAIFLDPKSAKFITKKIVVGGGWKPGHSSDGAAVGLAKELSAGAVINLSNIDYVYTDDPRKNPEATPIEKISWTDFRKLLPTEWNPGVNAPFDPVAAEMAQSAGISVAVLNGKNLENLSAYLSGETFKGTLIS